LGTIAHQVALLDGQRVLRAERAIAHEAVALHALTEWLRQLAGGEPARVAVTLEVPRGADMLLDRCFHVFALNPKRLDRFRDRYTVAGAKDDLGMRSGWPLPSGPTSRPSGRSSPRIPAARLAPQLRELRHKTVLTSLLLHYPL
jgi:hypothetical protein